MPNLKTCFFSIVSDDYYFSVGTHVLINSFKKYHPDIDLVVFRQDMVDKVFKDNDINFYMAKPTFAKLLVADYDRVINIDADTVITGRLTEILDTDWEVGAVWNYNIYENATFEDIDEKMYVQAGLVGSTNKGFWDIWEKANKNAMLYTRQENDVLNTVWYRNKAVKKMKKLIWDKDKNYLGCKSLGMEARFYIEDDKLMCMDEQVKAYHHAKGKVALPKLQFEQMGFTKEVTDWLIKQGYQGRSVKYGEL